MPSIYFFAVVDKPSRVPRYRPRAAHTGSLRETHHGTDAQEAPPPALRREPVDAAARDPAHRPRPSAADAANGAGTGILLYRRHHDPHGRRLVTGRSRPSLAGSWSSGAAAGSTGPRAASGPSSVRRRLYALNGGRPFVTAEHPFLTAEGWKALDPEATRRENAALDVASLQLGDRLCRGTRAGRRRRTPLGAGLAPASCSCRARRCWRRWPRLMPRRQRRCSTCCSTATIATSPTAGSCTTRMAQCRRQRRRLLRLDGSGTGGPSDTHAPAGSAFGDGQKLGATRPVGIHGCHRRKDGPVADFLSDLGMRPARRGGPAAAWRSADARSRSRA